MVVLKLKSPRKLMEEAALRAQIAAMPDATLAEHCIVWEEVTGQRLDVSAMYRKLVKLGISRKRSPPGPAKGVGANAMRSRVGLDTESAFRAQIASRPDATLAEHCAAWRAATGQRLSISTMRYTLNRLGITRVHRQSGGVDREQGVAPRPRPLIGPGDAEALRAQVAAMPNATLADHCAAWHAATGVRVGATTMHRALAGLGLSRAPGRRRQ